MYCWYNVIYFVFLYVHRGDVYLWKNDMQLTYLPVVCIGWSGWSQSKICRAAWKEGAANNMFIPFNHYSVGCSWQGDPKTQINCHKVRRVYQELEFWLAVYYSQRGSAHRPVQAMSGASLDTDPDAYDEEAEAEEAESSGPTPPQEPCPPAAPTPVEAPSATAPTEAKKPAVESSWPALEFHSIVFFN